MDMGCLALTRRRGERLCIGNDVTVEIAAIKGNRVTLLIFAPKEMPVLREELAKKLRATK